MKRKFKKLFPKKLIRTLIVRPILICLNKLRTLGGKTLGTKNMDYQKYLELQKLKTEDTKRRKIWLGIEFESKVKIFENHFDKTISKYLDINSKILCVGARTGQEVLAFKKLGYEESIGVDIVPFEPHVIYGDMHALPFSACSFSAVFSNCFDHSLYPLVFIKEVRRVLIPGGYFLLQIQVDKQLDKFGVTNVYSIKKFRTLLEGFLIIDEKSIEMLSMDYEFLLKKI